MSAPLHLRLTVPRWTGIAGVAVNALLGITEIGALFERGRVGEKSVAATHSTFDVELDEGVELGGDTKLGPIGIMKDGPQVRVTVPWAWGGLLRKKAERVAPGNAAGKAVMWGWFTPRSGVAVEIPLMNERVLRVELSGAAAKPLV
jgi:hypothetical protein